MCGSYSCHFLSTLTRTQKTKKKLKKHLKVRTVIKNFVKNQFSGDSIESHCTRARNLRSQMCNLRLVRGHLLLKKLFRSKFAPSTFCSYFQLRTNLLRKFWTQEQNCSWEKNLISRPASHILIVHKFLCH